MIRMLRIVFLAFALTAALLIVEPSAQAQTNPQTQTEILAKNPPKSQAPAKLQTMARAQMLAARAPLVFEPNRGQAPADVQWLARGSRFIIGLTSDGAALEFRDEGNPLRALRALHPLAPSAQPDLNSFASPAAPKEIKSSLVKLHLAGGGAWKLEGASPTGGISNYFIGNAPKNWHMNIPHFAQVKASGVYDGIDLVFHGAEGALEYDFVVAPGADPRRIELQFEGAKGLRVDQGDLVLATPGGAELRHLRPKIHQQVGGRQVAVAGGFEIRKEGTAGFTLGSYDPKLPLVIDPTITFTRFLAGSDFDSATSVAVDPLFDSFVTGTTYSGDFPTQSGFEGHRGHADVFVTRLNPQGGIVFSTFLGGGDDDFGSGIAVDASGVYITGSTKSDDFPTKQAVQWSRNGDSDAFVTKLSLLGNSLVYSTYLGGGSVDTGAAIAVDANRSAYVAGVTSSGDFPVTPGAFEHYPGDSGFTPVHGFVTKLSPSGGLLVYSTYLGASSLDRTLAIAVDASLSAIVTGDTCSFDFPFAGYFSQSFPLSPCSVYLTKLSPAGDSLIYSTGFGAGNSMGRGVSVDAAGNAWVVANTFSGQDNAIGAAFVTKVTPAGAPTVTRVLEGSDGSTLGLAIATDADGETWVAGNTSSTTFPGAPPLTPNPTAGFLVKLDKPGSGLLYTILLGASINAAAVIKPHPRVIVRPIFPTIFTAGDRFTGGTAASNQDAFVVRVDEAPIIVVRP
ncbi:MAG TPA: SBBP repeat-containing protein [Stellaceae bacterium]|nr:SBBP repeat-containing protein [Stellaceae bacterium]